MFDPQHLEGARLELVQSMFKIGRKAAELKRTKLQSEIRKEESELRRKKLEKHVQMASNRGTKGGHMKSLKQEDKDDDFLEDLVVDSDPKKPKKPAMYSTLKPGGFVTKAEDRKGRLEKRRAKIETAEERDKDDEDDDDDEETEKEQLEREARELQSELKKTERAAEKARDQEEKEKARRFSKRIQSGVFLKQPQAVSLVQTKK